ncbi:uncharacterized protein LOC114326702 [Diabrotica virgifera virgifera]|uniref:Uncharacterized protein LOC114326702 n=1 Tax=Diabrotica virgifera virgifera TaxID=50390 RepID=A0A6P7F7X5_DIAVI|nr:uncharacterized protein LOC114326702 [Diabrotica virgifera virgifera]
MKNKSAQYKYCIVPGCQSTTVRTSNKHFFTLPVEPKRRSKWLKACRRDKKDISQSSKGLYVCEDHFDLERDMANYMKFKIMGGPKIIKSGVVPHIFDCQPDRKRGFNNVKKDIGHDDIELNDVDHSSTRFGQSTNKDSETEPEPTLNYTEKLISAIEKRSKERNSMIQQLLQLNTETDEMDLFFRSIAMTVKKFPGHLQRRAKMQTLTLISNIESEMWSSGPGNSASAFAQEMHSPSSCSNTIYTDTVPLHFSRGFCNGNVKEDIGHDDIELNDVDDSSTLFEQSTNKDCETEPEPPAKEPRRKEPTRRKNMNYRENLISAIEKRSKERDTMIQQLLQMDTETDETDLFFKSITVTVKKFPGHLQRRAKMQTLTLISNIESEIWSLGPDNSATTFAQETHSSSSCSNMIYTDTVPMHFSRDFCNGNVNEDIGHDDIELNDVNDSSTSLDQSTNKDSET